MRKVMMATKRKKNNGWEYVIKRAKILIKPIYLTFDDEAEGDAHVAKLEKLLAMGVVPHELMERSASYTLLAELIRDYLIKVDVPDSDKALLNVLYGRIGTTRLTSISYAWVESWIVDMKTQLNLKPGTIRHHVGALGRCFDWAGRRNIVALAVNPIRQLPKTYAQSTRHDGLLAKRFDEAHDVKEDAGRGRRRGRGGGGRRRAGGGRRGPAGGGRP